MRRRNMIPGDEYAAVTYPTGGIPKRTRVRRVRYVGPGPGGLRVVLVDKPVQRAALFLDVAQGRELLIDANCVLMPWDDYHAARRAQLAVERVNEERRAAHRAAAAELQRRLRSCAMENAQVTVISDEPIWEPQQFRTEVAVTLTPEQAERLLTS